MDMQSMAWACGGLPRATSMDNMHTARPPQHTQTLAGRSGEAHTHTLIAKQCLDRRGAVSASTHPPHRSPPSASGSHGSALFFLLAVSSSLTDERSQHGTFLFILAHVHLTVRWRQGYPQGGRGSVPACGPSASA